MRNFDTLQGGSRARLTRYRHALARSLETIRGCRTPEDAERFITAAGYTSPLNHRGPWMGDAHGLTIKPDASSVSAPWGLVDGWRDMGDAGDIVTMRHNGWYADEYGDTVYRGHVWQLPARDGRPNYVAGYVEDQGTVGGIDGTRAGGYVVLECYRGALVLYDEKEDAARAGDALAESAAEEAREYDARWQEASRHDAERERERDRLAGAHLSAGNILHAWRAQRATGGPLAPEVCALLRLKLDDARAEMRD